MSIYDSYYNVDAKKLRFIFLTAVMDYLKVNNYRIAAHTLSKTPAPLASRTDIAPLVDVVKENENIDIVGLAPSNKIFLARAIDIPLDELTAHSHNDPSFLESIKSTINAIADGTKGIEFIFITTGLIKPELMQKTNLGELIGKSSEEINKKIVNFVFLEMRIDPKLLAKFDDQKTYLRNIITRSKWLDQEYSEFPDFTCDICSNPVMEGKYSFKFWENELTVPYWICPNDGAQFEAPSTSEQASRFITGFR
ncbi:MAG: hypothetical protein HeimC3_26800 [Candidatus Heimdallarchaeota archaeon LC_3]|nr:MAG: hypothetical protein HeimC3_26800 [Candidatus Heimdallarchaeota archaeon LC_3]